MMISSATRLYRSQVAKVVRTFTSISPPQALKKTQFPPRPKIKEEDIEEVFIKGGGKGGQKINKTNSKVQLRHIPTGIVLSSQFSRSREQNRKKARELLALKIEDLDAPEGQSRNAIIADYKKQKARKKKAKSKKKYRDREEAQRLALLGEQDQVDAGAEVGKETVLSQSIVEEIKDADQVSRDRSMDFKLEEHIKLSKEQATDTLEAASDKPSTPDFSKN